jgi:small neutral amino acid transporter SnatA (MarC family)
MLTPALAKVFTSFFLGGFVSLVTIINPPSALPLFSARSDGMDARAISRRLGANGIEAMTRLMGFLLLCIGVQFIASGVRSFLAGS